MADHLSLPSPRPLGSRRNRNGVDPNRGPLEPDRPGHATTLAGVLAGLGLPHPGDLEVPLESDEETDSRIVLVFEGRAALTTGPFRRWLMTPLAEGAGNTFLVLTDSESRRLFAELVDAYGGDPGDWGKPESWRDQLDAIEGVRLYGPGDRASADLGDLTFERPEVVDVLIWPSSLEDPRRRQRVAVERLDELKALVSTAAGRDPALHVGVADPRPDTTMVRVVCDRVLLEAILDHPFVERIRPPLRPRVTHAELSGVPVPTGVPEPLGEPVGVVDDLVVDNPYLDGVIVDRASFPPTQTFGPASAHGTNVAGIAAYGELGSLVTRRGPLRSPHPILGARIMQADPGQPGRAIVVAPLHSQLEAALVWLHEQGVKVAVCSLNMDGPDDGALPSASTATLDRLARELGMVVVVSAGNLLDIRPAHWLDDYPGYLAGSAARVADPGGAALALTVGSVAYDDVPGGRSRVSKIAIAATHQPSPFTRVGPTRGRTPAGAKKPEFVANGGNYGWDGQLNTLVQQDPSLGVITLAPSGSTGGSVVNVVHGTSFAAPFVANQVARLATRYGNADANLLRALTALSARSPAPRNAVRIDPAVVAAYGIPDVDSILDSGPRRVILTYQGAMLTNSSVIHEIPIPPEFATGRLEQQLSVALAFDPPVRRSRRSYVEGSMDFDFVRNMEIDDLVRAYERQPTRNEREANPELVALPLPSGRSRPVLQPGTKALASNTLIRRQMSGAWDPDDESYHLVVTHSPSPWARRGHDDDVQGYAIAVELSVRENAGIDLHALVQARLQASVRVRGRLQR